MKTKLIYAYLFGLPLGIILFWLFLSFNVLANFEILFYRGLLLIGIICIVQIFLFLIYLSSLDDKNKWGGAPHAISIAMICLSANLSFFIVVPVSLDRSVSVFLLGYMHVIGSPVTKLQLEKAFNDIYVVRYEAIDRRIEEQLASGNLVETTPGYYKLTDTGISFINFSRFTAKTFNIDKKFVEPIVSKD